jgi:hypothetical protein
MIVYLVMEWFAQGGDMDVSSTTKSDLSQAAPPPPEMV